MPRLTGLDAAFLALETPSTHLHIMGTMVFDPAGVPGGLGLARIRSLVAERLHLVPPFRMRMVEVPFGLHHPTLVEDPDVDLDYHVRRVCLPSPGGTAELTALVADLAARPLDRSRPLWEFHVVEGVERGRIGLVAKVHHAIADGVSGAEVLAAFVDVTPDPTPRPLVAGRGRQPDPGGTASVGGGVGESPPDDGDGRAGEGAGGAPGPPGELERIRDSLVDLPGHVDAVARTIARTVQSSRALVARRRDLAGTLPPVPFQAPQTSINGAISPHRRVAFADLPMAGIRQVAAVLGGTANDVVLAAASGALRALFAARAEEPDSSLVALVPVSVRRESEREALGNRVSAMLVSLATGVADPVTRFRRIREGTAAAKAQTVAIGPDVVASWAAATLPAVAGRLSRLVADLRVFDHVAPLCNLVVSNVPGPDVPLYLAGARMTSLHPLGPIAEGVGVNITVFSYLESVHVGIQVCRDLVPDVDLLARSMESALDELVVEATRRDRPVPWWHAELPA